MRAAVDQQTISCMNQRSIIGIVKKKGRITRAGIAQLLKLSPPSVSSNIEKLLQKELVLEYETDSTTAGPGRKGKLIGMNNRYAYILCINLSGPTLRVGIGNICEEIVHYGQYDTIEGLGAPQIMQSMMTAIGTILKKNMIQASEIAAIVVCSPGVIDAETGKIEYVPQFPGWEDLDVSRELKKAFDAHIMVINDINVIAYGELTHGAGKESDSFVYINIDLGVGSGIIVNRNLLSGYRYAAGEIGYMLTSVEQLAYQPQQGHLESLICVPVIRANIAKKLGYEEKDMTISKINQLYQEGNYVVRQEIEYVTKLLSMCIINITAVLNTPLVCLGGMICEFDVGLDTQISDHIRAMVPYPPKIITSTLGAQGFIRGALHLGVEKILDIVLSTE